MSPHFRVIKLRHSPRHPTQVEAHAVFRGQHIQFFCHDDVYMHYSTGPVNLFFRWLVRFAGSVPKLNSSAATQRQLIPLAIALDRPDK